MLFYGISFHKKLFDSNAVSEWSRTDPQENPLSNIQKEVKDLLPSDNDLENDVIENVDNLCTLELAKELSGKQEEVKSMLKIIDEWLSKQENKNRDATASVIKLKDFLKSIVDTHEFSNAGAGSSQEGSETQQLLEWDLSSEKNGLVQKINNIDRWWRFSSTLTNIKTVLNNPTQSKVKQLQQYIFDAVYAKLSVSEQNSFKSDTRFSNSGWNWLIDAELLEWVGIVLTRIENMLRSEETDRRTVGGLTFNAEVRVSQMNAWVQIFSMEASSSSGWGGQDVEASSSVQSEHVESQGNGIYNIAKERLHLSEWEKICLMDVAWKKYFVKLDSGDCLYPLALSVDWNNIWNTVLLQNNTSCMEYLRKKIPDVPYCRNMDISWNGKKYVIWVPGSKRLTIEPMTFDGKWLGGANLDQSLALLCFVNYLRNSKDFNGYEFKNDNPDLDWDDWKLLVAIKKNKDAKKASWEKDKALVDLTTYGLWFLSDWNNDDIRRRFIRYNNWEHREDNWNKKGDNQGYWALDVQQVMEEQQRLQAAAGQRQQSQGEQWNWRVDNREGSSQFSVDVSSQTLSLTAFSGTFSYFKFWIEGSPKIYESGTENDKTYYWKNWGSLYSVSEKTPYLKSSKNFDWEISTGKQLDVGGMTATLNVCDKWKDSLMSKIESVYKGIYLEGANFDAEIIIDDDTYALQWPKSWDVKNKILLWGDEFVVGGKIFGYDVDKSEDWLKVVCYAVDNYEKIKGGTVVVNKNNEYGINNDNKDNVAAWLKSWAIEWVAQFTDLVVLPDSIDEIWSFVDGNFNFKKGVVNIDGVLTIWGVNYSNVELSDNFSWLWYCNYKDEGAIYFELWFYENGKLNWNWVYFVSNGGESGKYEWWFSGGKKHWYWIRTYEEWSTFKWSWNGGQMQEWIFTVESTEYQVRRQGQDGPALMKIVWPNDNENMGKFIDQNDWRRILDGFPAEASNS